MTSSTRQPRPCHCSSQRSFESCCAPFLARVELPATCVQLMRSRYSAFCENNTQYLIDTLHPAKVSHDSAAQLASLKPTHWLQLRIIDCQQGEVNDDTGIVTFVATYRDNKGIGYLYEKSRFAKEQDRWFYVDGDISDPATISLKRNDTCWCASGKKFKKCHGA